MAPCLCRAFTRAPPGGGGGVRNGLDRAPAPVPGDLHCLLDAEVRASGQGDSVPGFSLREALPADASLVRARGSVSAASPAVAVLVATMSFNPNAAEFVPSWAVPPPPETDAAKTSDATAAFQAATAGIGAMKVTAAPAAASAAAVSPASDAGGDAAPPASSSAASNPSSGGSSSSAPPAAAKDPAPAAAAAEAAGGGEPSKPAEADGAGGGDVGAGAGSSSLDAPMGDGKKHANLVFIGHVDAGKSTISGHILYLTGNVDERTMEKFEREAKAQNRESWKYAWALDTTDQERAKGKTEECGRASFTTATRRFTILDAPGHKNFVPHMIGGASQADVGLLVISARKGEFETGFDRGGQTREHAMLAKTTGVRQLIILVNKMDDPTIMEEDGVSWSKARFDEVHTKLWPFLRQIGWKAGDLTWLPVSGLTGANVRDRVSSEACPWYKGDPLLDILEKLKAPDRLIEAPVVLPVFERYKEMGTVVLGKLEAGVIRPNDKLILMPNNTEVIVDDVQLEGSEAAVAEPGDNVRLRIKGVEEDDVRPGFVLCSPGTGLIAGCRVFDARLMILEHKSIIVAGYSAVLHCHAAVEECTIERLLFELDKKGDKVKKNPRFAKPGMTVIARLSLAAPICIEPYKTFPSLGRFMIRDEGRTIGVGVVLAKRQDKRVVEAVEAAAEVDA